jgi:prolyl-tRNA editing enzyme YbaK/EbsC (Cys-tRNA(Pro) deacylase)
LPATSLPEPVASVSRFLERACVEARLQEFRVGTPTAEDAARAIGCELDQIVKSLLFLCDGEAVLALVPGSRRADPRKVAAESGARTARVAPPDVVRDKTGFQVGGVAPFPLPASMEHVLADRSLLAWKIVWVGAGSDRHMAGLAPPELVRLTRCRTVDLCVDSYHEAG